MWCHRVMVCFRIMSWDLEVGFLSRYGKKLSVWYIYHYHFNSDEMSIFAIALNVWSTKQRYFCCSYYMFFRRNFTLNPECRFLGYNFNDKSYSFLSFTWKPESNYFGSYWFVSWYILIILSLKHSVW